MGTDGSDTQSQTQSRPRPQATAHPKPQPDSALEALFYHTDRVRFLYWEGVSGVRATVYLLTLVAIATFVTGLSHLSREDVSLDGPLSLPFLEGYVAVGGVVLAFMLLGLAFELHRRKRLAWYGALVVVPLAAVVPLVTFQSTDLPLLLLVVLTLPKLFRNRHEFNRRIDLSPIQIAALTAIVGVLFYGAVGSYTFRDQFANLETWGDAVYFVIATIATVGFGDITPVTEQAKWFTISIILLGTGAFTATIGTFIIPAIQDRVAAAVGTMTPELTLLEDHVLVLGYSDITEALVNTVIDDAEVVVVTPDAATVSALSASEMDIDVIAGDPTETATLRNAGIGSARSVVVATDDDGQDVLSIIAVRQLDSEIPLVAAATDQQHIDKLEAAGANTVVSPTVIAGQLLGETVLEQ